MADTSDLQFSFQAGEWSAFASGIMGDQKYRDALTLARNYLPLQEGGLARRSGWRRLGPTKGGAYGRLLAWSFTQDEPYLSEFTDSFMRLWQTEGPNIYVQDQLTITSITLANPCVLTASSDFPAEWTTGRTVWVKGTTATTDEISSGAFGNRQFVFTRVSDTTCTLVDAITNDALDSSGWSSGFDDAQMYLIYETASPYLLADIPALREVQTADIDTDSGNPESKVIFLHGKYAPRSLSSLVGFANGLATEAFSDGPYCDPPTATTPLTPSGTTGVISLTAYVYDDTQTYSAGDFVLDSGTFYESLLDSNEGNDLTGASPTWWIVTVRAWETTVYEYGSVCTYNGTTYYSLFDNNQINTPGVAPAAYNAGTSYSNGDAVTYSGSVYISLANSNTGHTPSGGAPYWDGPQTATWTTTIPTWDSSRSYQNAAMPVCVEYDSVQYTLRQTSTNNEPDTSPLYWTPFTPAVSPTNLEGFTTGGPLSTDIGRLIRLNWGPANWSSSTTYAESAIIQYNGNIYSSLVGSNKNNEPDLSPTDWSIETYTTQWTWAKIVNVDNAPFSFDVQIMGQDLPDTGSIWLWQLGLYSDTTGWPTCGAFHEGRLVLAGPQKNRFDMSVSNDPFNFSPTAVDGTVADNNSISYIFNAEKQNEIYWFAPNPNGLVAGTLAGEWLVSASSLDDPLTPTTIQARRVTTFGAANIETTRLPTAQGVVQGLQRQLLEYKIFIDISSYSAIFNATDLTHYSKHLTVGGIEEVAFQSDPNPTIWSRCGDGSVFACSYKRAPDQQYYACSSLDRADGRFTESLQVQVNSGGVGANPWIVANNPDSTASDYNVRYVEYMADLYDEGDTLDQANFTDGCAPCAIKYAGDTLTFYGYTQYVGQTFSIFMGTDLGDAVVAADGTLSVTVPDSVTSDFLNSLVHLVNATTPPINLDGLTYSGDNPDEDPISVYCSIGLPITSKGQRLRQIEGGQNGPNFAKTKRSQRAGFYVWSTHEFDYGTDFSDLQPFPLTQADRVSALAPGLTTDVATGIFRDTNRADYTYDNMLCWQQTRPYPGVFLGVGGFSDTSDV